MAILNYTNEPLLTREKVEHRNAQFWKGEVEDKFEYVVTDRPQIIEAYESAGIPVLDTDLNPIKGQDRTSETPNDGEALPDDLNSLPWPKLKSLASKKAGYNVMTKADALEVLQSTE